MTGQLPWKSWRTTGGIDVDDAEQILDDLATVKSVEASRDRGLRDLEMLRQMRPAQYDEAQMELAQATTSTAYRAWAADHGFTSLGRVDTDANGNVDLSTYIPGRDDMPARRAFERELKRGEGNYGFRASVPARLFGSRSTVRCTRVSV